MNVIEKSWDEGLTEEAKAKAASGEATLWQWTIVHLSERIEALEAENADLRQQLAQAQAVIETIEANL